MTVSVTCDDQVSINPCNTAAFQGFLFEFLIGSGYTNGNVALCYDRRLNPAEVDISYF
jgi:hypothetical protein